MKPVINHLIQLQELIEARAQQETLAPIPHLEQLNQSIATLTAELPAPLGDQFVKLQKKQHVAIVPVSNGVCSGCGMSLPVSLVHAVKAAEQIYTCPNCARLLYSPTRTSPRRIAQAKRRFDPPKVGIARFSSPSLMIAGLEGKTRDDVIEELCMKLEAEDFVDNGSQLVEAALRREAIMSTAVDHGLAFPHIRGVEGGGLALALGTSKKGIKFGPTRTLTRIVFLMVIPTAASAFYLKLLSGLTQAFQDKKARDKLLEASTTDKLWKALVSTTKSTVK